MQTDIDCLKNPTYTYQASTNAMNWRDARRYCHSIGGDLAMHGMKNFARRVEIANGVPGDRYWIGAHDLNHESVWEWVDGSFVNSNEMHWNTGQPDDGSSREDCAEIIQHHGYGWKANDHQCQFDQLALCEIRVDC